MSLSLPWLVEGPVYRFGKPAEGVDALWRCEAKSYSYVIDADFYVFGTTDPRLELMWTSVKRRTEKGAYIAGGEFVPLWAKRKRWCNTEEEAIASFVRRREVQISILKKQLARAERELALASKAENHE